MLTEGLFRSSSNLRRVALPHALLSRHARRHLWPSPVESKVRVWPCAGECGEHRGARGFTEDIATGEQG